MFSLTLKKQLSHKIEIGRKTIIKKDTFETWDVTTQSTTLQSATSRDEREGTADENAENKLKRPVGDRSAHFEILRVRRCLSTGRG